MNAYPERVWKLFREPRRAGVFDADIPVRRGEARTPASAAILELQLKVSADGRIEDARFRAFGCPYMIATGAWLCGHVIGRLADATFELDAAKLAEQLQLPVVKRYCAVMACEALQDALTGQNDE